jgi:hypothetical protein
MTWDSVLCPLSMVYLSQCTEAKSYCRAGSRNWILKCRSSSTSSATLSTKLLTRRLTCSPSPVSLQQTRNVTSIVDQTDAPLYLFRVTVFELDQLVAACGDRQVCSTHPGPPTPRFILKTCCSEDGHCINVRERSEAAITT